MRPKGNADSMALVDCSCRDLVCHNTIGDVYIMKILWVFNSIRISIFTKMLFLRQKVLKILFRITIRMECVLSSLCELNSLHMHSTFTVWIKSNIHYCLMKGDGNEELLSSRIVAKYFWTGDTSEHYSQLVIIQCPRKNNIIPIQMHSK